MNPSRIDSTQAAIYDRPMHLLSSVLGNKGQMASLTLKNLSASPIPLCWHSNHRKQQLINDLGKPATLMRTAAVHSRGLWLRRKHISTDIGALTFLIEIKPSIKPNDHLRFCVCVCVFSIERTTHEAS